MKTVELSKRDVKSLIKQGSVNNGTIYLDDGKKYKLYRDFINDMMKAHMPTRGNYGVNRKQVELLCSKQRNVEHSTLPSGILTYDGIDVGVIYPRFFYGYKSFDELSKEDSILLLKNIRRAILNNEELFSNGIFVQELLGKDIIYSGEDVQIVDLDGKYIKTGESVPYVDMYTYFIKDIYRVIDEKLRYQCRGHASEYSKHILELRDIIDALNTNLIDYPKRMIDEIEKRRILK